MGRNELGVNHPKMISHVRHVFVGFRVEVVDEQLEYRRRIDSSVTRLVRVRKGVRSRAAPSSLTFCPCRRARHAPHEAADVSVACSDRH